MERMPVARVMSCERDRPRRMPRRVRRENFTGSNSDDVARSFCFVGTVHHSSPVGFGAGGGGCFGGRASDGPPVGAWGCGGEGGGACVAGGVLPVWPAAFAAASPCPPSA